MDDHDERIQGRYWTSERAKSSAIENFLKATREGWGDGPIYCYWSAAEEADLVLELKNAICDQINEVRAEDVA